MKKIVFYIVCLLFVQCTGESNLPDDLSFSISNATDSLSFPNGIYTRSYNEDTVTVKITFNDLEQEQIKKWYVLNKLNDIEEDYNPDRTLNSLPAHALQVVLNMDGKKITIFYDASYGLKDYFKVKRIKRFIEDVNALVREKEEVKKLPRTDITFF